MYLYAVSKHVVIVVVLADCRPGCGRMANGKWLSMTELLRSGGRGGLVYSNEREACSAASAPFTAKVKFFACSLARSHARQGCLATAALIFALISFSAFALAGTGTLTCKYMLISISLTNAKQ